MNRGGGRWEDTGWRPTVFSGVLARGHEIYKWKWQINGLRQRIADERMIVSHCVARKLERGGAACRGYEDEVEGSKRGGFPSRYLEEYLRIRIELHGRSKLQRKKSLMSPSWEPGFSISFGSMKWVNISSFPPPWVEGDCASRIGEGHGVLLAFNNSMNKQRNYIEMNDWWALKWIKAWTQMFDWILISVSSIKWGGVILLVGRRTDMELIVPK